MELQDVLLQARARRFLGSLPIEQHLENGRTFAGALKRHEIVAGRFVDLGSGGGVPAFVILAELSDLEAVLVERGERRAEFLRHAADELGFAERVQVVCTAAEDAARWPDLETSAVAVTARSFAPPAVTAECAARFLTLGGRLFVSEPPGAPTRWDAGAMVPLGLALGDLEVGTRSTIRTLVRSGDITDPYPRRASATRKRPLW